MNGLRCYITVANHRFTVAILFAVVNRCPGLAKRQVIREKLVKHAL